MLTCNDNYLGKQIDYIVTQNLGKQIDYIVTQNQLKNHETSVCLHALDSASRLAQQPMTWPVIQSQYKTHLCWPR